MTRLNLVLLLAVLLSALYLVRTQYQSRQLVTELDRATSEALVLPIGLRALQRGNTRVVHLRAGHL